MTGLSRGANETIARHFPWNTYRTFADIGTAHAYRGEADAAITWLERAYRQRRGSGMELLKVDPLLRNLRSDPRYKVLLHKMNLPD